MESSPKDNLNNLSRNKTVRALVWIAVGLDIVFFMILYAKVDIYGQPRGYEIFFNPFDTTFGSRRRDSYLISFLAFMFAYLAHTNSTDRKLISRTILAFNTLLFLTSFILNIYFILN